MCNIDHRGQIKVTILNSNELLQQETVGIAKAVMVIR